ncbi:MAG: peptide chain release factor 2 [Bacilli bacterium]
MEINEISNIYEAFQKRIVFFGGYFDPEKKQKRVKELTEITKGLNFWNDKKNSEIVMTELNNTKNIINNISALKELINSNLEIIEIIDDELKQQLEQKIGEIEKDLTNYEMEIMLNGPYDKGNAMMEIHAGAGGTEACDWADMLKRMYLKWCEKKKYKIEIIDEQQGEEAGIKGVTILIKGKNSYGYLFGEKGVHRLVRISPFDSNSRRHTSFASVDIMPLFDNKEINLKIKENDLKIDVYRSSGAGGQSVNTTDSAVRITHLPTKTVVTCQNQRSQIQNKEKALEILENKLYQQELEKRDNEIKKLKGQLSANEFGSQIRSYVMHPYSLVKDHRTKAETSNVSKVLDGDIELFIKANLKDVD